MPVDSFKYLPRILATYYRLSNQQPEFPIPWTPVPKPLSECTFGLVTTGGLYLKSADRPFDMERERKEPTWGDPTYREIPVNAPASDIGVSHLHLNTGDILADPNILLPIHRFQELAAAGRIRGLANQAFSFMGYQGYPPNTREWQEVYGPRVVEAFQGEGVDCVLITPA
ncbi:MAG: hypothetical protein JXA42_05110 [Anaerolineales bacterium]|nr:hypothetical protein [Anaerolineales bacterium]